MFGDDLLVKMVVEVWSELWLLLVDKFVIIENFCKILMMNFIVERNFEDGKEFFFKYCGVCYKLFGEGGDIGFDFMGG